MKRTPLKSKVGLKKKSKNNTTPSFEKQQKIRYNIGQRDGAWCFRYAHLKDWPSKYCTGIGQEYHHIIPRSRPFKKLWHICNGVILCTTCHAAFGQNKIFREALLRKLKQLYDYPYEEPEFQEYLG